MSDITFDQFRQNVKAFYKQRIRSFIEPHIISVLNKYRDYTLIKYNDHSFTNEIESTLQYYIQMGMDSKIVYEVYNDIIAEYSKSILNEPFNRV